MVKKYEEKHTNNNYGASLVQISTFYDFGEVPTPWYKK